MFVLVCWRFRAIGLPHGARFLPVPRVVLPSCGGRGAMGCSSPGPWGRRVRASLWMLLVGWILPGLSTPVRAAEVETRDFSVSVDGKHAGDAHMTIYRQEDGTLTMT